MVIILIPFLLLALLLRPAASEWKYSTSSQCCRGQTGVFMIGNEESCLEAYRVLYDNPSFQKVTASQSSGTAYANNFPQGCYNAPTISNPGFRLNGDPIYGLNANAQCSPPQFAGVCFHGEECANTDRTDTNFPHTCACGKSICGSKAGYSCKKTTSTCTCYPGGYVAGLDPKCIPCPQGRFSDATSTIPKGYSAHSAPFCPTPILSTNDLVS